MFDLLLDAVTVPLLLLLLLLLLVRNTLRAGVSSVAAVFRCARSARAATRQIPFVSEFSFDRAIEAYEDLIDATCAEGEL